VRVREEAPHLAREVPPLVIVYTWGQVFLAPLKLT
jgi:hypothetical protein